MTVATSVTAKARKSFSLGKPLTRRSALCLLPCTALLALGLNTSAAAQTKETVGGGTLSSSAVGPAPSFGIGGSNMVLVKNWHFGTDGTITDYADMSANFLYHDQFGTINNGGNYGASIVAPDAADALSGQPIEGVNGCPPVRQFETDSLRTYLVPLDGNTSETMVPSSHNAGCGSFMANWTLPAGGALLGRDIVWETRVRYVTPPYFWFALWTVGNQWNNGAEHDLIESFGFNDASVGGPTNYTGTLWHSNTVPSATDQVNYNNGWNNGMASVGITSYDPTQYHIWTWYYKHDNTYAMYVDGTEVQYGSGYPWTDGAVPPGNPNNVSGVTGAPVNINFLCDAGWGSTQSWTNDDFTLPASAFAGTYYEFNYSRVYLDKNVNEAVYNGPHTVPGTIQAEDYDTGGDDAGYYQTINGGQTGYRTDNNGDIHTGAGTGGNGYAVGWSAPGNWYDYKSTVQTTGTYTATFQVASDGAGGTFHLQDQTTGKNLTGSLTAPNTGSWGTWQTVTSPKFTLSAGAHTLRLVEDAYGSNAWVCDFDLFTLTQVEAAFNGPHTIPGTIQAEDYDTGGAGLAYNVSAAEYGAQTGYRTDNNGDIHTGAGTGGNGYAVGWSYTGDWYNYTAKVATAGTYTATFQVASDGAGGTFHLQDQTTGKNLTGSLTAPNTGSWGTWQTVTSPKFTLSVGTHVLRLVEDADGSNPWVCDFDWFSIGS